MLTCLADSKKIRLLSCRLTTLPQIVSQRSLLWQNVQESNHSTHFLLVHPLSKAELLLFFLPLFFFKFRQKIDYLRNRRLRPVNAVTKEETVPGGIIYGSPLSLQIPRFGVVLSYFLYFSSIFFPFVRALFSCNSHQRLGVKLLCNFIPCNFLSYFAFVEEVGFFQS